MYIFVVHSLTFRHDSTAMAESTITTKGQCVVPKKIREYLGLNPGDKIDFVIREDGEVLVWNTSGPIDVDNIFD